MHYNPLGSTGLFVSELSLGTMTFGASGPFEALGHVGQADAEAMLRLALDAGINVVDTADTYSGGDSERIVGRAIRELGVRRDDVVLATKVFGRVGDGPNRHGSSRAHVTSGLEASLARLETDYVDLYQLHGFDPATPIEETLGALDDLVRRGLVRYVGVSNWAAWQISKALGISAARSLAKFASLQAYYSLAGRDLEREIVPMLESEGLGLLVWSPLAGGFLGGGIARDGQRAGDTRRAAMAFPPVDEARGLDVVDALHAIARRTGATVPQLAIAWLLQRRAVTSVVLGARRIEQLADTLAAVDVVLEPDDLAALDAASALRPEYPGWMLDMWSGARASQLARARHGGTR